MYGVRNCAGYSCIVPNVYQSEFLFIAAGGHTGSNIGKLSDRLIVDKFYSV